MCDTSVQDAQIIDTTEKIATLNAEKNVLTAIVNPNAEILNLINVIDGKLQRLYLRLSTVNQTKAQLIAAYNATCNCRNNVGIYGANVLRIYDNHNP